jgi:hypothetical protein
MWRIGSQGDRIAMTKSLLAVSALAFAGLIAVTTGLPVKAPAAHSGGSGQAREARPVVLELFQSQGCSSCPPALAVLNEMANRPDVLALNFAVTYWDQLGWKDSFAQPAFTARQWDYARAGGRGNVQTPQLIVDGRSAILGSRKNEVEAAIARHRTPPGAPDIALANEAVTISGGSPPANAKVLLIEYDPQTIAVPIRAGENSGRTLAHRNVVRRVTVLGAWTGKRVGFPIARGQIGLARAILVQTGVGGPILAAHKI